MSQQINTDEVATVIQARKILKDRGFAKDVDIKTLCQAAGISRKTGYKHANTFIESTVSQEQVLRQELERIRAEHEDLKKRFDDVRFENKGRKIAWEIHEVDKLLAEKKTTMIKEKKKKR